MSASISGCTFSVKWAWQVSGSGNPLKTLFKRAWLCYSVEEAVELDVFHSARCTSSRSDRYNLRFNQVYDFRWSYRFPEELSAYGLTTHGYFGSKGKNCRIITTGTPVATSTHFYQQIGKGGTTIPLSNGKGTMTVLGDGTRIVHRLITSTPGSPAVEISISGSSLIKDQKIHFK